MTHRSMCVCVCVLQKYTFYVRAIHLYSYNVKVFVMHNTLPCLPSKPEDRDCYREHTTRSISSATFTFLHYCLLHFAAKGPIFVQQHKDNWHFLTIDSLPWAGDWEPIAHQPYLAHKLNSCVFCFGFISTPSDHLPVLTC